MWNKIREAVLLDLQAHFGHKVENNRLLGCLRKYTNIKKLVKLCKRKKYFSLRFSAGPNPDRALVRDHMEGNVGQRRHPLRRGHHVGRPQVLGDDRALVRHRGQLHHSDRPARDQEVCQQRREVLR